MTGIQEVSGIGPALAAALAGKGIASAEQLAAAKPKTLLEIPRIGARRVELILAAARNAVEGNPSKPAKTRAITVNPAAKEADDGGALGKASSTRTAKPAALARSKKSIEMPDTKAKKRASVEKSAEKSKKKSKKKAAAAKSEATAADRELVKATAKSADRKKDKASKKKKKKGKKAKSK